VKWPPAWVAILR